MSMSTGKNEIILILNQILSKWKGVKASLYFILNYPNYDNLEQ